VATQLEIAVWCRRTSKRKNKAARAQRFGASAPTQRKVFSPPLGMGRLQALLLISTCRSVSVCTEVD